nr:VOC family protein [Micromonospora ureilytica]
MSNLIRFSLTTVNAPNAIALARFYAEITGGVAKGDEGWALVEGPNGDIGFQQIDDYRPPTWPDGEVGMQMHLEFFVDDLEATGACAGSRCYPIRASAQRGPLLRVRRPGRASVLPVPVGGP